RFFFPAEDGIRDFHVTGVQTCALPISKRSCGIPHLRRISSRREGEGFQEPTTTPLGISVTRSEAMPLAMINLRWYSVSTTIRSRSEERRVGKEWRARWRPADATTRDVE